MILVISSQRSPLAAISLKEPKQLTTSGLFIGLNLHAKEEEKL